MSETLVCYGKLLFSMYLHRKNVQRTWKLLHSSFSLGYVCSHIGEHWICNLQFLSHLTSVTCFAMLCASLPLLSLHSPTRYKFNLCKLNSRFFSIAPLISLRPNKKERESKERSGIYIASRVVNALIRWWVFHNFAIAIQTISLNHICKFRSIN